MKPFILFLIVFLISCGEPGDRNQLKVLVYSKTNGYRHESISSGVQMINDYSKNHPWKVTFTEDSTSFNEENLSVFDVVVFLNTSGNVLDSVQQKAFEGFLRKGKGFVGIHGAADTEYENLFYKMVNGAHFRTHPPTQEATLIIENRNHPAMKAFRGMTDFTTVDEWYSFGDNPRNDVHVLATLEETSVKTAENDGWKMGDHPVIWWREKEGIRSFYTVFGHTPEAFQNPVLIEHFCAAIDWAGKQ